MKILNKKTDTLIKGAALVCRPSLFGNPFKIGKDIDRADAIARYKVYFNNRVKTDQTFVKQLVKIKDATALVCWCAPEKCHAEVIRDYLMAVKAKDFMESCKDDTTIGECWEENKNNGGGFAIHWSRKGVGFGVITFSIGKGGEIKCDNECMGIPFIKKVLADLVDRATMSDLHPKDKK